MWEGALTGKVANNKQHKYVTNTSEDGDGKERWQKINEIKHIKALTIESVSEIQYLRLLTVNNVNGIKNHKALTIYSINLCGNVKTLTH